MAALNDDDRQNLVPFLDGELDEEAAQALEAKLSRDPTARAELEELRQVYNLLDYLPRHDASPSFTQQTMEKLQISALQRQGLQTAIMPRPRRWAAFGWAAAIVAAAGLGYGGAMLLFKPAESGPDVDETLVRHLRAVEKFRLLENVDHLEFARQLDHPDLFGDEGH